MILVAGPSPEIIQFIQILCWILVPVLLISVLAMIWWHYRKKKSAELPGGESGFMTASPEQVGYTRGDGEYVLFDHSDLISEYKKRLSFSHARYTALQKDLEAMQAKYNALANYTSARLTTSKKHTMNNPQEQMPKQLRSEMSQLADDHAAEKNELLAKIAQLEKSYERLEQENRVLKEQQHFPNADDEEKAAIINRWKEENISLRDKLADLEYFEDLVEEKKAQIVFLQNQVEQRLKNLYQSEHQRLQAVAEMNKIKESREELGKEMDKLKEELMLKQDQSDKMQMVLCEKEEKTSEQQQALQGKQEHIHQLENELQQLRQQNESLEASVNEGRQRIYSLEQQLDGEQAKSQDMGKKINAGRQLVERIYGELSVFMAQEKNSSPVISLRPDYLGRGSGETAL